MNNYNNFFKTLHIVLITKTQLGTVNIADKMHYSTIILVKGVTQQDHFVTHENEQKTVTRTGIRVELRGGLRQLLHTVGWGFESRPIQMA